jgi:hypothetical protein
MCEPSTRENLARIHGASMVRYRDSFPFHIYFCRIYVFIVSICKWNQHYLMSVLTASLNNQCKGRTYELIYSYRHAFFLRQVGLEGNPAVLYIFISEQEFREREVCCPHFLQWDIKLLDGTALTENTIWMMDVKTTSLLFVYRWNLALEGLLYVANSAASTVVRVSCTRLWKGELEENVRFRLKAFWNSFFKMAVVTAWFTGVPFLCTVIAKLFSVGLCSKEMHSVSDASFHIPSRVA